MRQTRPELALISRPADQYIENHTAILSHLLAFVPDKGTKSLSKRLCQEVKRITQGQVSLLLHCQDPADHQSGPPDDCAIFPVRYGQQLYGTLHVISNNGQPTQTAFPLDFAQVLAKVCGMLLYHFGLAAFIEGQTRRLSCQVYGDLTNREMEVLKLVCRGHTQDEISDLLQVTLETVSTYQKRICRKLDIHSERDIPLAAYQTGLYSIFDHSTDMESQNPGVAHDWNRKSE